MKTPNIIFALFLLSFTGVTSAQQAPPSSQKSTGEPGLLFYLSGDKGFNADYAAGGNPEPNFLKDVKILPGGAERLVPAMRQRSTAFVLGAGKHLLAARHAIFLLAFA